MLRKRKFWVITLLLLVVLAGATTIYIKTTAAAAETTETPVVQTATVRRGEIVISATGAGTVIAAEEIELNFITSGRLTELLVDVGDKVTVGDILARVDDTDAQQTLLNAQLQYTQAAMQTDASATKSGISYDDISIAQAELNLEVAQASLEDLLNWEADADEIAQLEAKLAASEASYNAARGQEAANSNSISIQNISVEQAERSLADAQTAYNTAWDPARDWELNDPHRATALEAERSRAADAFLRAEESLEIARLNYNATVANTNHSSSANAESNLLAAQIALQAALSGPTEDDIAAAERAVKQAELALQQTILNQEANALKLAQAELNVNTVQGALDGTVLAAPINGTVMSVNAGIGENVGTVAVMVLANLTQPLLELYLDETDLNMVGVGFEVEVVFDALPEETFTGQIIQVDPQLVQSNNLTTVHALVQLNSDSFAKPQTLPVGLNATVEVIGGKTENALLVPVEALRELSDGQYAVFVMESGEPRLQLVEVGLMDFTSAEILSGLSEGDVVTTGIVETE